MTTPIPAEFSTRLIDGSSVAIMGSSKPPRDPDQDDEDEDEDDEEKDDRAPAPVVREPDEDGA